MATVLSAIKKLCNDFGTPPVEPAVSTGGTNQAGHCANGKRVGARLRHAGRTRAGGSGIAGVAAVVGTGTGRWGAGGWRWGASWR